MGYLVIGALQILLLGYIAFKLERIHASLAYSAARLEAAIKDERSQGKRHHDSDDCR